MDYQNGKMYWEGGGAVRNVFSVLLLSCRLLTVKLLIERGRWMKPIIELNDRRCTLCNAKDIEDEYHVLMICSHYKSLRMKFVKKFYYQRPSVYKFHISC